MQKPRASFLFLVAKPPFSIGIYDEANELIEAVALEDGKASDLLPLRIRELLTKYEPLSLFYTNGPGNQMSIKICYVCLKSVCIVKDIPLYGVSSFEFNDFGLIELANKRFFCFENDKIVLKYIENANEDKLRLPLSTRHIEVAKSSEPVYILPPA